MGSLRGWWAGAVLVSLTTPACHSAFEPSGENGLDEGVALIVSAAEVGVQDAPKGRAVVMRLDMSLVNSSPESIYYRHSCAVALERQESEDWVPVWEPDLCTLPETPLEDVRLGEPYSVQWEIQALLGGGTAEAWHEPITGEYRFVLWIYRVKDGSPGMVHSQPFQVTGA